MKKAETETLKNILENIHQPWRLDEHPWVQRDFVKDVVERNPDLQNECPGQQLSAALAEVFLRTMPGTPPRRGKRLDTHWGEFGMLAALYFGPIQFGLPVSRSLRDAWGRIDQAILLYAYGCDGNDLSEKEIETYRLVGDEPDIAAASTLSDWHCKGIQKLADAIPVHERHLKNSAARTPLPVPRPVVAAAPARRSIRKAILPFLIFSLVLALALAGYKAQRIYHTGIVLREDIRQLQGLRSSSPDLEGISKAGPLLSRSRQDFDALSHEVSPLLWLGDWLGWVPVYGGDLAASRELLSLADRLLASTESAYAGLHPLLIALNSHSGRDPSQLVVILKEAEPELTQARQSFDQALALRSALDSNRLSTRTRSLLEKNLDPLLPMLDDGLAVATALPRVLGAASDGPKTYLLLAQNEDELRPTGGFITAAGTLVVENGKVIHLKFVDSGELENWDFPYPAAPWQLEQYMNSPVLILRDANWFPDFRTSALYAESLYAYSNSHSVDGVIAFDQHLLVSILEALGPIQVEGESDPIDASNVIQFMRSSKTPPAGEPVPAGWSRKGFMDRIASALVMKIFREQDVPGKRLGSALLQSLNQEHLLLQLDDPTLTDVIARHGWDGAMRPSEGDFLKVVDTNIGFNKTNAVVETRLAYDLDFNNLKNPASTLTVTHHNNASADVPCLQWGPRVAGEEDYPIDACYWNYMRVYTVAGTSLLDATPQNVPAEWMILERAVNSHVDILDEELEGLQAFGTLMVVPGGQSVITSFHFRLPENMIATGKGQSVYQLHVDKQPGTLAIPITIRVHLPPHAILKSSSLQALAQNHDLLIETNLQTDVDLKVVFAAP